MPERLTPLDASFLYLENPTAAMHVGSVMVFDPPEDGFDHERLLRLVSGRLGQLPRYRKRVREVPGRIGAPVWVDDTEFDLSYHVRRAALPRPGTPDQLAEFVARIQSRPLDRRHPLWEMYFVEGLADGRFAVVTKTHEALVDGVEAVDIGHVVLDDTAEGEPPGPSDWTPQREPGSAELLLRTLSENLSRPGRLTEMLRGGAAELTGVGRKVLEQGKELAGAVARVAASPTPAGELNVTVGASRRWCMVRTDLDDYRRVRDAVAQEGGAPQVSINDVMLAALAGGLRTWLLGRGAAVRTGTTIRALVPVTVADDDEAAVGIVNRVAACLVDLPVGEPNPRLRLQRIAYQRGRQTAGHEQVSAATIAGLAGFAPPTLHHLGVRLGSALSKRVFNLVVTNSPGPQQPRYAAGALLVESYPVIPLSPGQALSVGMTSYRGSVFMGLNADRRAMPDLDVLAEGIRTSLAEYVEEAQG